MLKLSPFIFSQRYFFLSRSPRDKTNKYTSSRIFSAPTSRRPFRKCTYHRPQHPSRTRSARVRCFSFFFAFTSSPHDCKKLGNSDLRVKASSLFSSSVKAKKNSIYFTRKTHWINELGVKVKGEGRNCELAECAMRRDVSVRAYGGADEETASVMISEGTGVFSKKRTGRREKKGRFVRKSTSFYSTSPHSQKPKHVSHKTFDHSKLNPYFCA